MLSCDNIAIIMSGHGALFANVQRRCCSRQNKVFIWL